MALVLQRDLSDPSMLGDSAATHVPPAALVVQGHPQFEATVGVSYVEIYNDSLVDLLGSLPSKTPQVRFVRCLPIPAARARLEVVRR